MWHTQTSTKYTTMRQPVANLIHSNAPRLGEQGSARTAALLLVFFLLGLGAGAYWYYRATKPAPVVESDGKKNIVLSDSTKAVLRRLPSPVDIRFYSLLDPATASDPLPGFARRVDQLLSAYQQEANGKIKVTRFNTPSDANAQAAAADGIQPSNRDRGDVCYLGLAVVLSGQKELLPQLAPEWEPAVEFDLTRAIVRVMGAQPSASGPVASAQPAPAPIEEVKRAVPDLASVSVEEGTRILREAALKDFAAAANEMELRQKEAQQRVTDAQGKSEAEQQAARKNLQQVQLEQAEKLKQVAARLQAQIIALQQLKKQ